MDMDTSVLHGDELELFCARHSDGDVSIDRLQELLSGRSVYSGSRRHGAVTRLVAAGLVELVSEHMGGVVTFVRILPHAQEHPAFLEQLWATGVEL